MKGEKKVPCTCTSSLATNVIRPGKDQCQLARAREFATTRTNEIFCTALNKPCPKARRVRRLLSGLSLFLTLIRGHNEYDKSVDKLKQNPVAGDMHVSTWLQLNLFIKRPGSVRLELVVEGKFRGKADNFGELLFIYIGSLTSFKFY